jgi:UDP-N-acetyl-D-mannosaminuronate dehydrogenase
MDVLRAFADKIADGQTKVGIIGLGYVGLPTAIGFHDAGFRGLGR